MGRSRGSLALFILALALFTAGPTGCGVDDPTESEDTGNSDDPEPDTGMATDTESRDDTGDDTSTDTDTDDGEDDGGGSTEEIPDEITTEDGASFTGDIGANARHDIDLVAEEGDVVVMHLRRAEGTNWQPALYLFGPDSSGDGDEIAWHEPEDDGSAHLPYKDEDLSDGWEFYNAATYRLELRNLGDTAGKFHFELECLGGPCDSSDDDPGGGGEDDIPAAEDNCPSTGNPDQTNSDHDIWGDACDPTPETFECPESLAGAELEERLRAAYAGYTPLDYNEAREQMYSRIDNEGGVVEAVYTGETIRTTGIPDPDEYNTEHTWPRSMMRSREEPTLSDLNHLFPADKTANEERSNLPFDEVTGSVEWSSGGSKRGTNDRGWTVFAPRDAHKGNVARSLFYYSVIYERDVDISAEYDGRGTGTGDEATLREWHYSVDPVTERDEKRNVSIQEIQGNRNPFVDCPDLVDQIDDF